MGHIKEDIDACIELDELSLEAVGMLDKLAPFGQENPEHVFLARNVTLTNRKAVGADKNHFSCVLANGRCAVGGIMFHCDEIDAFLHNDSIVDAVFTVQIDEWRGRRSVKAMLSGLYPACSCAVLEACLDPAARGFLEGLFEDYSDSCDRMRRSDGDADDADDAARDRQARRAHWEKLAQDDPDALEKALIEAIIGDGELYPSQRTVLDRLREGSSVLAIMATGRGKSLVFQVHAAMQALKRHEASLFVYPLRALIADQAFHLENVLDRFGLACAVLTGENTSEERDAVYQGLARGTVDVVLTTPEYFSCHIADISSAAHIGFVVVDEAHHIGLAHAGHRSAYTQLGDLITQLGCSTVLAATATAPDEMADDIDSTLSLDDSVIDETERENLTFDDQRNIKNRDAYLASLIACGGKTVIYVNSREQSVAIARSLRRHVPQIAQLIGFYNAGLARSERCRIEELFRHDELMVLVATSAFGEGIDIPDIRHVVLYHLPFNEVEFSQMSGRAGRDGQPATIHLLYGRQDVALNEGILADTTPDHDVMAQVYRHLRARQREAAEDYFCVEDEDLAQLASSPHAVTLASADCGVAVFCELGLIETRVSYEEGRPRRWVHVNEDAAKVDLSDSVRYREGMDERDVFKDFCDWAMNCDAQGLAARVTRPIFPRHRLGGC